MRVAILGCGVMGSAFARQLAKHGHEIILMDRHEDRVKALAQEVNGSCVNDPKQVHEAELILLAIKPKDLRGIARAIGPLKGQIVMSILAGITLDVLKELFSNANVIRCMPNLALTQGESVISLVKDPNLNQNVKEKVDSLLNGLGLVFWTEESKIDAITALAGSGPAFVIAMIESLIEGGILVGLRADEAKSLALQTVLGAVALLKSSDGHPGEVRWQICAPGGTTIEGMKAFEDHSVRSGIINTILATYKKTKEMDS